MYGIIGWTAALAIFVILETATAGLVSIWFAGGAAAALVCAAVGAQLWVQIVVFLVLSVVLLMLLRPMAHKWVDTKKIPTNADRAIGQNALVVEDIDRLHNRGAVRLGGVEWSARTDDGAVIAEGSLVRVLRIEGAYVYVELVEARPDSLSPEKVKAAFLGK